MFGIGPGQASVKESSKMSSGGDAKLFARVRAFLLRFRKDAPAPVAYLNLGDRRWSCIHYPGL